MPRGRIFIFLLFITLISAPLRYYKLGNIPNGLSTDEADMAYNAYTIMQTGADVYGKSLPLFFQALDDYKPGLVFYTIIPTIFMFGLNEYAVRFAPFIFGVLTLVLIFTLIRLLYPKVPMLAYISAMLAAFAPWHIALSRVMIWYIELIFAYLLFFVCFSLGLRRNKNWLILSGFILGLTLYIYYAALIYLPFLIFALVVIFCKDLIKFKSTLLISAIVFTFVSIPALSHYLTPASKTRFNAISVLTADVTLPTSIKEMQLDQQDSRPFSELIHNRRLVYASSFLGNYLDYFNLDHLFVNAKNVRYFYTNNVGLFYLLELPFVIYGLYILIKRRDKPDRLILALLMIGPIPAAFTLGSPFPHRALLTILSIQLISAIGVSTFLSNFINSKSNNLRPFRTIIVLFCITYGAGVYFFIHQYFIHSPKEFTSESDNGAWFSTVRDVIPQVTTLSSKYEKVVFTWSSPKLVPPVYFLFYNKVNPKIIQERAAGWTNEPPSYRQIYEKIGNIEFRQINWESDVELKNTLFVGYPSEFPKDVQGIISKTYLPNGNEQFILVENP